MYLSRVPLNANQRETMRALALPNLMHGAVEQSFDGERQRRLWRVDWLDGKCYLLVLSPDQPDFTNLAKQFGYPNLEKPWETKGYAPLLDRLQAGQTWRFRLLANPVHSIKGKDEASARGKVLAHVTPEQQRQWLLARSKACGFVLEENKFDVVHTQWLKFNKGGEGGCEVTLRTATFEGVLTIADLEQFKETLLSGVGRAKAYGCGLMTVVRYGG